MKSFSIRSRIMIILLFVVLIPTVILGFLAYWSSAEVIIKETIRVVGYAASSKKELLIFRLQRQQERGDELLSVIDSSCRKRMSLDFNCTKRILSSYMKLDSVLDAELTGPENFSIQLGQNSQTLKNHPPFSTGQLAQFSSPSSNVRTYLMMINSKVSDLSMTIRYSSKFIDEIFESPHELGTSGETFLSDQNGFFITKPRYHSHHGTVEAIDALPMKTCLSHQSSEMLAGDYRPVPVIHGFRYIPEIGGGCIMAHIQQDEAFLVLENLKKKIFLIVLTIIIFTIALSFLISGRFSSQFTNPISKLLERMKAAQAGDLDSPVLVDGPIEVVEIGNGLQDLTIQLKRKIHLLEDFVAIVSHDLKSPICALSLNIELLDSKIEEQDLEKYRKIFSQTKVMRRCLDRMTEMIGSVLNLTTIRTGKFIIDQKPVSLNSFVESIVESFDLTVREKSIEFKKIFQFVDLEVQLDEGRIHQVVSNILSNAIKFTPKGGEIIFEVIKQESFIRFGIIDTGPGIPKAELGFIFERYHQLTQSGNFSAGLGLYISKEIVTAHGGEIWAESSPGQGSSFYFTIPL